MNVGVVTIKHIIAICHRSVHGTDVGVRGSTIHNPTTKTKSVLAEGTTTHPNQRSKHVRRTGSSRRPGAYHVPGQDESIRRAESVRGGDSSVQYGITVAGRSNRQQAHLPVHDLSGSGQEALAQDDAAVLHALAGIKYLRAVSRCTASLKYLKRGH